MKIVRLTLTIVFALCLTAVSTELRSEEAQKGSDKSDAIAEAAQKAAACVTNSSVSCHHSPTPILGCGHRPYHAGPCINGRCEDGTCKTCDKCQSHHRICHEGQCIGGLCENGTCQKCDGSCIRECPVHGKSCQHDCLNKQYGYGVAQICPGKINGVCPIHGYGVCPHQRQVVGPFLRQALQPADRPYFGAQPLYVPREQYDPGFEPRFPRIRALLLTPPAPAYSTVAPPVPMPTYTTRGPRDFLNPNPPSIGY